MSQILFPAVFIVACLARGKWRRRVCMIAAIFCILFGIGALSGLFANKVLAAGAFAIATVSFIIAAHEAARMKFPLLLAAILLFLAVIVLESRAALLAAFAGAACANRNTIAGVFKRRRWMVPVSVILVLTGIASLYSLRPGSVNARLLIWRVCSDMIADKPLIGFGADGFRQNYMLYQAAYFKAHPDSPFIMVAGNAAFPFNDLVRMAVERGLPAALALVALLVAMALRSKSNPYLALPLAFCTFASFSYPSYCLALALTLPFLMGLSSYPKDRVFIASGILASVLLGLLPTGMRSDHPNYEWWMEKSETAFDGQDYDEAERLLLEASMMIPTRVKPDWMLWKLYRETGDEEKAEHHARQALTKKTKTLDTWTIRARKEILDSEGQDFLQRKFILDNLKYHKGWKNISMTAEVDGFFKRLADSSGSFSEELSVRMGREWDELATSGHLYESVRDSLTEEELAANIAEALRERRDSRFADGLSERDFNEMLLPFIGTHEESQLSRKWLREKFAPILGVDRGAGIREIVENYKTFALNCRKLSRKRTVKVRDLGVYEVMLPMVRSDCRHIASVTCDIFRACGIPLAIDYTPKWPDMARGHFWCVVQDSTGRLAPFTPPHNAVMEDWDPYIQDAVKIYRINFAEQKGTPTDIASTREFIPGTLRSPLISDQTWRYHKTVDLTLDFPKGPHCNLAYLCVFDTEGYGLTPIAWGEVDKFHGKVTFQQVPADVVFFPVYYDRDGEMIPFDPPFSVSGKGPAGRAQKPLSTGLHTDRKIIRTRKCDWIKPDGGKTSLTISRKYPDKSRLRAFRQEMPGTCILGSDAPDGPFDTLAVIQKAPLPYLQQMEVLCTKPYCYFSVSSTGGKSLNLAHIEFLSETDGDGEPTPLPVFSAGETNGDDGRSLRKIPCKPLGEDAQRALDEDMLTFCHDSVVVYECAGPSRIDAVRFAPRNADNIITPGDVYDLYYYDYGWQHHSSQTAKFNYLVFDDVPSGTLFWVSDRSKGKEELPFLYENGAQRFINNYSPGRTK